jgi:hypothetical protein
MSDDPLKTILKFDYWDLEANRAGKISANQSESLGTRVKLLRIVGVVVGSLLIILGAVGSLDILSRLLRLGTTLNVSNLVTGLLGIAWLVFFAGLAVILVRRAFRAGHYTLLKVEGPVKTIREEIRQRNVKQNDISNSTTYRYYLAVGPRKFKVDTRLYSCLKEGDVYDLYYAQSPNEGWDYRILSMEPPQPGATPAASAATPAALPLSAAQSNEKLSQHFNFDDADLSVNRGGTLSEKQSQGLAARLNKSRLRYALIGLGLFILGLLPLYDFFLKLPGALGPSHTPTLNRLLSDQSLSLVWCFMLTYMALNIGSRAFRFETYVLQKLEGPMTTFITTRSSGFELGPLTNFETTVHELHIGKSTFLIDSTVPTFLNQGDYYRLYYAQGKKRKFDRQIMSLEPAQPPPTAST